MRVLSCRFGVLLVVLVLVIGARSRSLAGITVWVAGSRLFYDTDRTVSIITRETRNRP